MLCQARFIEERIIYAFIIQLLLIRYFTKFLIQNPFFFRGISF